MYLWRSMQDPKLITHTVRRQCTHRHSNLDDQKASRTSSQWLICRETEASEKVRQILVVSNCTSRPNKSQRSKKCTCRTVHMTRSQKTNTTRQQSRKSTTRLPSLGTTPSEQSMVDICRVRQKLRRKKARRLQRLKANPRPPYSQGVIERKYSNQSMQVSSLFSSEAAKPGLLS